MNEALLFGGLVVASVVMIVYALMPARKDDQEHVLRRMTGRHAADDLTIQPQARSSAAQSVLEKVAPLAMKPVMPKSDEEMSTLRERLAQAGFRRESATRMFLASKTIIGCGMGMFGVLLGLGGGYELKLLFGIGTCAGGVGFFLPDAWLWLARSQRQEKIRHGLPDSLDLLVVSVESGLALDAGLQRVSDEMRHVHTELSEEMQIATLETQMGVPRSESLQNMARRCGVSEMNALIAVITQAEKFGTSVAKALRVQADSLRVKRRLQAEERAQKTAVKLMLPLIFFIFPSIFVVLLGPAVLQLAKVLGKGGPLG